MFCDCVDSDAAQSTPVKAEMQNDLLLFASARKTGKPRLPGLSGKLGSYRGARL